MIKAHRRLSISAGIFLLFGLGGYLVPTDAIRTDSPRCFKASLHLIQGQVPYRDFKMEYPPGALIPFVAPRLLMFGRQNDLPLYQRLFVLQNALLVFAIALLVGKIADALGKTEQEGTAALLMFGSFSLITVPYLPWRFDPFPTFFTVAALLASLKRRPAWAGASLGLAIAVKLYPVAIVPIFALYHSRRETKSELRPFAAGLVLSIALIFAPLLVIAPKEISAFLSYHAARGLQMESLGAGLLMLLHALGLMKLSPVFNFGAYHLSPTIAGKVLLSLLPCFFLAGLIAIGIRLRMQRDAEAQPRAFVQTVFLSLLLFVLTNKVFSPQFIGWLIPFAAFALGGRREIALFTVSTAITTYLYPYHYRPLIYLQPLEIFLLNIRNLGLLALFFLRFVRNDKSVR
jgi:uncharacterized membrane protein